MFFLFFLAVLFLYSLLLLLLLLFIDHILPIGWFQFTHSASLHHSLARSCDKRDNFLVYFLGTKDNMSTIKDMVKEHSGTLMGQCMMETGPRDRGMVMVYTYMLMAIST